MFWSIQDVLIWIIYIWKKSNHFINFDKGELYENIFLSCLPIMCLSLKNKILFVYILIFCFIWGQFSQIL